MRRRSAFVLLAGTTAIAACAHGGSVPPRSGETIARPLEVYHDLGMMTGPADFPVVARLATFAGPADSSYLMLGMSMPNSAIRFQRDAGGFAAQYRVNAVVLRDTQQVRQIDHTENVRVASFMETNRTDESVLFQDVAALQPGSYIVRLQVNDLNSARGFHAVDTVQVPSYPRERKLSTPLLVYQAAGRTHTYERPGVVLNPRNTVPFGSDNPFLYVEMYGEQQPEPVTVRVVDESGALVWTTEARVEQGTPELRHAAIEIPAATLPIGKLWLEAAAPGDAKPLRTPLLVTISDQWVVANFGEVLRFLEYIASPAELDSLRKAQGADRKVLWDRFWARRDPLPATPTNEFRDQFFDRVKIATEMYEESGRPGWDTDRGRVYIVLGPPDNYVERQIGRDTGSFANVIEWMYESLPGGRLILQFVDRTGFGRFELTQQSESAFRVMAARLRPRT